MLEILFSECVSQEDFANRLAQQVCSLYLPPQMEVYRTRLQNAIDIHSESSHALDSWWQEGVMKVSGQCGIAAATGNQILGLIRQNIVYKENN